MQYAAHVPLQRGIDHLVLLHARFSPEGFGDDRGRVVIAVPRQILDGDLGIGEAGFYLVFDLFGLHRHVNILPAWGRATSAKAVPG